jgi:DNA-binding transcriptional regulator YiaG
MVKLNAPKQGRPPSASNNLVTRNVRVDEELLDRLRNAEPAAIRQLRFRNAESQQKFWSRFGVTQSSGSRFETGLHPPRPVLLLLELYARGLLPQQSVGAAQHP